MIVRLLTEHHFKFLSLTGGHRGSSESTLVKMSKCWKSQTKVIELRISHEYAGAASDRLICTIKVWIFPCMFSKFYGYHGYGMIPLVYRKSESGFYTEQQKKNIFCMFSIDWGLNNDLMICKVSRKWV